MNPQFPFGVGDKVVLALDPGVLNVVPQLVQGRLYCVSETFVSQSKLFGLLPRVRLVGVRRNRRCRHTDLAGSLPACYFRRVNGASSRPSAKGGA